MTTTRPEDDPGLAGRVVARNTRTSELNAP